MGKKWLPHMQTYIYTWNFLKYLLDNCTDKPFLYLRYIDNIFVIWQHGEDKLEKFHAYVNSIHPNIRLTLTSSAANISYLDISVSLLLLLSYHRRLRMILRSARAARGRRSG